jgi:DNA-binding response OmpR family regulator
MNKALSRVLVIESEPWLAERYQAELQQEGFTVTRATNGYTAIDIVDETTPNAIVMSLLLDGPGAIGLLHEMQSYIDTGAIPVIVCTNLTGLSLAELQHYGVRQLIDSTAVKPGDIAASVRSVLA